MMVNCCEIGRIVSGFAQILSAEYGFKNPGLAAWRTVTVGPKYTRVSHPKRECEMPINAFHIRSHYLLFFHPYGYYVI
jgi:hypothetical protein